MRNFVVIMNNDLNFILKQISTIKRQKRGQDFSFFFDRQCITESHLGEVKLDAIKGLGGG